MKRKILFFVMMLTLTGLFTMQSCKKETTGSFKAYGSFTDPVLLAPVNSAYVTVSGTTIDLKWESTDSESDPNNWDVYFGTSATPPLVKSGNTTQTYTATIAKGKEYFWHVVGTDANGIPTRSATWSFKVIDPAATLTLDMSWTTDVKSAIGLDLPPDEVVDMRLLVLKASDKSIVAVEDGATFETYADFNSLPNGSYLIATDIFATINAGDFNAPVTLDMELVFNQPGIIDQTLSFPKVINNLSPCSDYFTILASVVKVGTTYTIQKSVSQAWTADINKLVGKWSGVDNFDYVSQVVTTKLGTDLQIDGLGFEWLSDFWGEEIQTGNPVNIVINWNSSGSFTIPNQYYLTTLYAGDLYPYNIVGSGTFITCGEFPVMIIQFDLVQDGFSTGTWLYNNKYAPTKFFTMTITLDGGAKGMPQNLSGLKAHAKLINKPTH
jgi:hypothetical protein